MSSNPWKIKGEPLLNVDATPTLDYPLRILRAYRQNCNLRWALSTGETSNGEDNLFIAMLNKMQDERAAVLDRAIAILEANYAKA